MDDTCRSNRANPPFTHNIDITPCSTEVFWILVVGALLNQILRNIVWIQNAQITRETLALDKDDPKRSTKIFALLFWTALSFVLYIFAFLIIVGGNVWFLLAILCGNLIGTYYGMSQQKPDEHINQAGAEMLEWTSLLKTARCDASNLSEEERRDLCKFKKEFLLFIKGNESAQNIIASNSNTLLKF